MKITIPAIAVLACLMLFGCRKKERPVTYSGRLLFTKKNPYSIANRNVGIDQYGSGGALGGSTFASAGTKTDATGFFQIVFTPGTSTFLIITSTNSNPLTLSGRYANDSTLRFSRNNFPDSAYDANKPMYIAKTIDTVIISVQLLSALTNADTIGLQTNTVSGRINREYTRRTGAIGSTIVLDTIYNMLFTEFDCRTRNYTNTSMYVGRKYTDSYGSTYFSATSNGQPFSFPENDQARQEIKFYYQKY